MTKFKPYLRFLIIGITLFFLGTAVKNNWQEITTIRLNYSDYLKIAIALFFNIIAYIWSAYIWSNILTFLKQSISPLAMMQIYLKTNIAKYIPGNIWHFYGRIIAVKDSGGTIAVGTISTLLEVLLMVASALIIASIGLNSQYLLLQIIALFIILISIHPYFLNPVLGVVSKIKLKDNSEPTIFKISQYPFNILLGEILFLLLRGTGFIFALIALKNINITQIPIILSSFSIAWLLGLIIPGAPGGLGVFETTAIALLSSQFSGGIILSTVAIFRLVTILSEAIVAGLAIIPDHVNLSGKK
jgi:glycosyltransferase 2 family protein